MEEIGPVFHLPAVLDIDAVDDRAWSGMRGRNIVTHRPTHSMFEIVPPDDDDDVPAVFRVRLIHVCAGCPIPLPDDQHELAHDALTFWAWNSGLFWQRLPGRIAGRLGWNAQ